MEASVQHVVTIRVLFDNFADQEDAKRKLAKYFAHNNRSEAQLFEHLAKKDFECIEKNLVMTDGT